MSRVIEPEAKILAKILCEIYDNYFNNFEKEYKEYYDFCTKNASEIGN